VAEVDLVVRNKFSDKTYINTDLLCL